MSALSEERESPEKQQGGGREEGRIETRIPTAYNTAYMLAYTNVRRYRWYDIYAV